MDYLKKTENEPKVVANLKKDKASENIEVVKETERPRGSALQESEDN